MLKTTIKCKITYVVKWFILRHQWLYLKTLFFRYPPGPTNFTTNVLISRHIEFVIQRQTYWKTLPTTIQTKRHPNRFFVIISGLFSQRTRNKYIDVDKTSIFRKNFLIDSTDNKTLILHFSFFTQELR